MNKQKLTYCVEEQDSEEDILTWQEAGENCILRRFIICTAHLILG